MEGGFHGIRSIFQGSKNHSTDYSYKQKVVIYWKEHTKIYTFLYISNGLKGQIMLIIEVAFFTANMVLLWED